MMCMNQIYVMNIPMYVGKYNLDSIPTEDLHMNYGPERFISEVILISELCNKKKHETETQIN